MTSSSSFPADDLPPGAVRRADNGTVANSGGDVRAVSARCRHQLADLSKGSIGPDGCLVCPWHGSRYDLSSGQMIADPRGFLGYHGPSPGYSGLVQSFGRVARLRVRSVVRRGSSYDVTRP